MCWILIYSILEGACFPGTVMTNGAGVDHIFRVRMGTDPVPLTRCLFTLFFTIYDRRWWM